jgi:hypothetical protein
MTDKNNKPIDFKYPAERKRWLKVYELALKSAVESGHDSMLGATSLAASLATSDMEIRRLVLIQHKDAPSYAEMAELAEMALGKLLWMTRERGDGAGDISTISSALDRVRLATPEFLRAKKG